MPMKIKTVVVGELQENCYLLKQDNNVIVIDPGSEFSILKEEIGASKLVGILITHTHYDHVGALEEMEHCYHAPVFWRDNLEEKDYQMNGFLFRPIFTPGHTSDSVIYDFSNEKALFTGDFLFAGSIGRTDIGGNKEDMRKSIQKLKRFFKENGNRKVYPGHGFHTTLEDEIKYNPHLKDGA